ncbi:hypothetical protein MN608_08588 [Microdochium nivale]|nr:hypothetical protein MN608_08588 [Microdochium nivale]
MASTVAHAQRYMLLYTSVRRCDITSTSLDVASELCALVWHVGRLLGDVFNARILLERRKMPKMPDTMDNNLGAAHDNLAATADQLELDLKHADTRLEESEREHARTVYKDKQKGDELVRLRSELEAIESEASRQVAAAQESAANAISSNLANIGRWVVHHEGSGDQERGSRRAGQVCAGTPVRASTRGHHAVRRVAGRSGAGAAMGSCGLPGRRRCQDRRVSGSGRAGRVPNA